jgi:hypothetical protein
MVAAVAAAPMSLVHNERVKLLATTLNSIALAFIVAGLVAPTASGLLRAGWHTLVTLVWIACGVGLHYVARAVLGRLQE